MRFIHTRAKVYNRGIAPESFLAELVQWGRIAPDEIFAINSEPHDVYPWVKPRIGPYTSFEHRRSVMLEIMRVLGGFESTWNWEEGPDQAVPPSEQTPYTMEAGLWQVSANSREFGEDLKAMSPSDPWEFQRVMKENHQIAMEYIARLLRHTVNHNGPVKRHEIDPWMFKESVGEFTALTFNP